MESGSSGEDDPSDAEAQAGEVAAGQKAVQVERSLAEAEAEAREGEQAAGVQSSTATPAANGRGRQQSGRRPAPPPVNATGLHVCASNLVRSSESGAALAGGSPAEAAEQPDSSRRPLEAANIQGAVCMMPSAASRERNGKRKESKTAQRAGCIILTFLVFWMPLVVTALVNWIVRGDRKTQNATTQEVEILSVSIACITSLSNPITYAAVNPHFRAEFYRLKNKLTSSAVCR